MREEASCGISCGAATVAPLPAAEAATQAQTIVCAPIRRALSQLLLLKGFFDSAGWRWCTAAVVSRCRQVARPAALTAEAPRRAFPAARLPPIAATGSGHRAE